MATYNTNKESVIATLTGSTADSVVLQQSWRAVIVQNLDATQNLFVNYAKTSAPSTVTDGTNSDGTMLIPPGGSATIATGSAGAGTNTVTIQLKGSGNLYSVVGTN